MRPLKESPALTGSGVYLLFYLAVGAYLPFINVYFHDRGLSGWQIGLLSDLQPVMSLLLTTPVTVFADRRRRRVLTLAVFLAGTAVTLALLAVPSGFYGLLLVMAGFAVFFSSCVPLADALIVGMSVTYRLNYGGMRLWGSIGFAVASLICGVLWQRTGYRTMFPAAGALFLVAAAISLGLEEGGSQEQRRPGSWRFIAGDRLLLGILVTTFLAVAATGVDSTFAGVYLSGLGGSGIQVGALYAIAALFELPAMRYSAALAARIGAPATLLVSYLLFLFTYIGLAAASGPLMALAVYVLRGLGFGLFYVGTVRLLNERTPKEWSATIQGIVVTTAYGAGQLLSRPAAGRIYDVAGGRVLYALCAATMGVASVLVLFMLRSRTPVQGDVPVNPAGDQPR